MVRRRAEGLAVGGFPHAPVDDEWRARQLATLLAAATGGAVEGIWSSPQGLQQRERTSSTARRGTAQVGATHRWELLTNQFFEGGAHQEEGLVFRLSTKIFFESDFSGHRKSLSSDSPRHARRPFRPSRPATRSSSPPGPPGTGLGPRKRGKSVLKKYYKT